MKYCFDREFPPRERPENCKELSMGSEDIISLSNPCYRENIYSCRPFYFTFWGKEKTTPCKGSSVSFLSNRDHFFFLSEFIDLFSRLCFGQKLAVKLWIRYNSQSITKESLAILARRLDRFYSYRLFPFWWR